MAMRNFFISVAVLMAILSSRAETISFDGKFFSGRGDREFLQLLDISRRMFAPDPEFQNLSMLYITNWNGLVEGPTWDAWWIQNSYGTTYASLPFLQEPFITFLQHSQDLWFDQMGDGRRTGANPPFNWVAPDGCLCDCARPGWIVYKQGDGRTDLHDWGMEFTAAGVLMQAELLLIGRELSQIKQYLPRLERSVKFIETRRGTNNLFLAGPAGNLLAPSYAGWKKPDGSYDKAYLTGLSITYIAALDRLIELEKLCGREEQARFLATQRQSAKDALALLTTQEGYFIRSLDPDGTRHGVFGSAEHGYFEASPNHDAIAFRVVDDRQAESIYQKIASIPGLRPHSFTIANYPGYDDMYTGEHDIWKFGTWINGGHWSTCEARMILGYYRLGKFDDALRSMKQLMKFAEPFRMDNPLTEFGNAVYQPNQAINLCYDSFGPPAAFIRGLFEYLYKADSLTLVPHIPPSIESIEQKFPVRFGNKKLFLSVAGTGEITRVKINGRRWKAHDGKSITLPYDKTPDAAKIQIQLGSGSPRAFSGKQTSDLLRQIDASKLPRDLAAQTQKVQLFHAQLARAGLSESYEAAHARVFLEAAAVIGERQKLAVAGRLKKLPERSQAAAEQAYVDTARNLFHGLDSVLRSYEHTSSPLKKQILANWTR